MAEATRILFVCTANVCRSPTAEHLARRFATADERLSFDSGGFLRSGVGCPPKLVREAASHGIDLSQHRSRHLDAAQLDAADLVVTMEVGHILDLSSIEPSAATKALPLVQLGRELEAHPRTLDEILDELGQRDLDDYLRLPSHDDVPDPYGRSSRQYRQAVEQIDALVSAVVTNLVSSARAETADLAALRRAAAPVTVAGPVVDVPPEHVRVQAPGAESRHADAERDRRPVEVVGPPPSPVPPAAPERRLPTRALAPVVVLMLLLWAGMSVLWVLQARARIDAGREHLEPLRDVRASSVDAPDTFLLLDRAREDLWVARRNLANPVLWPLGVVPGVGSGLEQQRERTAELDEVARRVTEALEAVVEARIAEAPDADQRRSAAELDEALRLLDDVLYQPPEPGANGS